MGGERSADANEIKLSIDPATGPIGASRDGEPLALGDGGRAVVLTIKRAVFKTDREALGREPDMHQP